MQRDYTSQTTNQVKALQILSENRFAKTVLKWLLSNAKNGQGSTLDNSLNIIAGDKRNATLSSLVGSLLLRGVLWAGAKSFHADLDVIYENLSNRLFRRALASVVRGLVEFGPKRPFTPGAPFQVVWNVTRVCNLHCKHCYEDAGRRGTDELDTIQAKRAIDILANEGVVFLAFSGGEPTLRLDILELISHASSYGMYVALATNGTTFANLEQVRRFKRAGLKFVQISLDGINPRTHDEFRGVEGSFNKTVAGIQNCVKEDLFVEIAMTVTHHNIIEVPEVIKFAQKLGAQWFMAYNFIPVGRGRNIISSDLTPEERETLLRYLWEQISSDNSTNKTEVLTTAPQFGRMPREIGSCAFELGCDAKEVIFPTHFTNARLPSTMTNLAEFIGGCGAGRFYLAMEPNGDLYPCVFFPHVPQVYLGNITRDDFHRIWTQSRVLRELRNKDLLKDHCGACENRFVCGGCRARAIQYFGDYLAPDPGCKYNIEAWNCLRTSEEQNELSLPKPHRAIRQQKDNSISSISSSSWSH